jgi:hypothetical protein
VGRQGVGGVRGAAVIGLDLLVVLLVGMALGFGMAVVTYTIIGRR